MRDMTIGKLARAAGVGVETVRFYERKGLIRQPPRPQSGYRTYDDNAVHRIRFIRQGQELGFSLREIGALMALRADPGADCSDVRMRARDKLAEVDAKMARLAAIRSALERVIAACPGKGALRACSIIDELAGDAGDAGAPLGHMEDAGR